MRIVHLCADDGRGGAGMACARLGRALNRLGHESRVLVARKLSDDPLVAQAATRSQRDETARITNAAIRNRYIRDNRTDLTNTHFTIHLDGADAVRHPLVAAADVIHLHWISDLLTPCDVRALMDTKPVVWTLHDLEPMTGGCHFPAGCEGYRDTCAACPQLRSDPFGIPAATVRDKAALWAGLDVALAAPSRWLAECALRSTVLGPFPRRPVVIPHALDMTVFRPTPRDRARAALGLTGDGPFVLCGAGDNRERRKGAHLLPYVISECAESVSSRGGLTLISVGASPLDFGKREGVRHVHLGALADDATMAMAYAAADLFVLPSLEDNLPNMLPEALSCGTPVVAFAVGGIGEVLIDGVNGRLVPENDPRAMSAAMAALLSDREALETMRAACRASVVDRFDQEAVGRRYVALYEELSRQAGAGPSGRLDETLAGCRVGPDLDRRHPALAAACLAWELKARTVETEALVSAAAEQASLIERHEADAEAQHRVITDLERVAAERLGLVQRLHCDLAAHRREDEVLHAVLEERDALIHALHEDVVAQRGHGAELRRTATERLDLIENLHCELAALRSEREALEAIAGKRYALIRSLHEDVLAQRGQGAELQRIAAERLDLIDRFHRDVEALRGEHASLRGSAEERDALIRRLHEDGVDQRRRSDDLERIAAERAGVIETLHQDAESLRGQYASLRGSAEERDALIRRLHEDGVDQRRRSDDLERIAAERAGVIETLHQEAESLRGQYASLESIAEERDALIRRLHEDGVDQRRRSDDLERIAAERAGVIETLHQEAESLRGQYASLESIAEERDALIRRLHEDGVDQRRRSDDLERIAAERAGVIETLHQEAESLRGQYASLESIAEERDALIRRLHEDVVEQWRRSEDHRRTAAAQRDDLRADLRKAHGGEGLRDAVDATIKWRAPRSPAGQAAGPERREAPPPEIVPDPRPALEWSAPRRSPWIALLRSVRFDAWWDQKLPPLTAVIFVTALSAEPDLVLGLKLLVSFVFTVACVAAYGHVINDNFDIHSDLRAGKPNPLDGVAPAWRALACVGLFVLGFLPVLTAHGSRWIVVVIGLNYLWPTIYSVPGLRLKERGVLGLVCDAAGSHVTPTILALVLVRCATGVVVPPWLSAAFLAWSTVLGLKGILYHQAADRENDVVSGVRTFATSRSVETLNRFFPLYNVAIELPVSVLLTVVCFTRSAGAPFIAVALGCYVALNAAKFRLGFPFALTAGPLLRRRTVPFADELFYTVWLPIAASLQVGARGLLWLLVPLLHGVAFHRQAALQWRDAASLLRHAVLGIGRMRHRNQG